jgi:hypothetical protein
MLITGVSVVVSEGEGRGRPADYHLRSHPGMRLSLSALWTSRFLTATQLTALFLPPANRKSVKMPDDADSQWTRCFARSVSFKESPLRFTGMVSCFVPPTCRKTDSEQPGMSTTQSQVRR